MPTTTAQRAEGSKPKRTLPQMRTLLRTMAHERGVSFTDPKTLPAAYREYRRLKALPRSTGAEIARERDEVRTDMATQRGDAAQVRPHETEGHGSSATWSRPELLATYTAVDGTEHSIYGRRGEHGVRVMDHGPGPIRSASRALVARDLHLLSDLKVAVHGWIRGHAADPAEAEIADYLVG